MDSASLATGAFAVVLDGLASLPWWMYALFAVPIGLSVRSGSAWGTGATASVAVVGLWAAALTGPPAVLAGAAASLLAALLVAGLGIVVTVNRQELLLLKAQTDALEAKLVTMESLLRGQLMRGQPMRGRAAAPVDPDQPRV